MGRDCGGMGRLCDVAPSGGERSVLLVALQTQRFVSQRLFFGVEGRRRAKGR